VAGQGDIARAGADAVFEYVARTAEARPGGVCWRTLTVANAPQYVTNLYNGGAGIALFLADYYRTTGRAEALGLARAGLDWCTDSGAPLRSDFPAVGTDASLGWGWAGVGTAWLRLAAATGESGCLRRAEEAAGHVRAYHAAHGPGPITRLLFGAAGAGLFLVRLWQACGTEQYLAEALTVGGWLDAVAVRSAAGCTWPSDVTAARPAPARLGLGTGAAGIGALYLALHEATGEPAWADRASTVAQTLLAAARPAAGTTSGVEWPWHTGTAESRCQWCMGEPGIGLFLLKAYEALGEPTYLAAATAAGETTFDRGDVRRNPGQCHGLAGNAEVFLELARVTGDARWPARAATFARAAMTYREAGPDGAWPVDEPGHSSPDLMCGGAGVGHFLLRLAPWEGPAENTSTAAAAAPAHPFA
jgi:lantibiotic modifying enzyme